MQGLLVFGHEVHTLQPCGDTRQFWVVAPEVGQRLAADYRRLATRAYEPVYAELEGRFIEHPAAGFAADYDGTIEIREIHTVSTQKVTTCRAAAAPETPEPTLMADTMTYVFVCDDQATYTVRATEAEAWIFHPDGTRKLSSVAAETGVKYANANLNILIRGQEAEIGETDGITTRCRNDRRSAIWEKAKLDGADFRALGNEPGWVLEIREGNLLELVADYGASRVEVLAPEHVEDAAARSTRWDAGDLTVEVIGRPCSDSMSGEEFEAAVTVTWQGRVLRGCGRALH
jgi:uncharacterized membrane protein